MPRTTTPDQAQLKRLEDVSIKYIDGTYKPDNEKMAAAAIIITTLQSHDDMAELSAAGFAIDYETREYVSKLIHDSQQDFIKEHEAWVQKTGLDNYVVGDGDWATGATRVSEINQQYYAGLETFKELYNKLWDDDIRYGVQYYWRYNTPYSRTANGEVYASGFQNSFLPWLTAPGNKDGILPASDGNTLGPEYSWTTPSERVAGESAGGRALVAIPNELDKYIPIDDWGDEDNGGYSDLRNSDGSLKISSDINPDYYYGDKANAKKTTSGGSGGGGGYSRGGSGGGGGGSRSGGGGYRSSSGSPRSTTPSIPKVNPSRIMSGSNRSANPNLDYLRPNFETKGSREAYKRSDI
jgi:hypothetical protein